MSKSHGEANGKRATGAKAVPELFEDDAARSVLDVRTDTLRTVRELGPPDIVYLVKQSTKSSSKQLGVYHHVTGIDASSSASLAAYINTLIYNTTDKATRIISGVYCCYNAFSRLDMRVQVKIPGTVESFCVNERGDQLEASEVHWLETFLCGVLRAYSYSDKGDGHSISKLMGLRRFNPIVNTESEHRFLEAAERLFFNGWTLGSDPEVQIPNMVSNHLASGLLAYIKTTGRYTSGANLFEKLRTREPEIAALLAQVYLLGDEEVKAVRLLHDSIREMPTDHALLIAQARFLTAKGRNDLAIDVAKRSVIAAPSEFATWALMTETYVKLEKWDMALRSLNSAPMFSPGQSDSPRLPEPYRVQLPQVPETMFDEIEDAQMGPDMSRVPPPLRRLGAATYKGTFERAYMILTEISKTVGWDQLLRIRSETFVMEEEYRTTKPPGSGRSASATAIRAPDSPASNGRAESALPATPNSDVPDSAVSRQESVALSVDSTVVSERGSEPPSASVAEVESAVTDDSRGTERTQEPFSAATDDSEPARPTHTVPAMHITSAEANPDGADGVHLENAGDASGGSFGQLRHKRLCERWLDNLFMVLYEDLRIYTIWRTESAQAAQQQTPLRKTADEWEILGALAERLHHRDEALEAWQACLESRFSPRAMKGILDHCERKRDTKGMLDALMRLIAWQCRWYSEFSPDLLRVIRVLIEEEGELRISSYIRSTSLPTHIQELTMQYVDCICRDFRSAGAEA